LLYYITWSQDDYWYWWQNYSWQHPAPSWFYDDFGKPGMNGSHNEVNATIKNFYQKPASGSLETSFLLKLRFEISPTNDTLRTLYGAPDSIWAQFDVDKNGPINITITFINKTTSREVETSFLTFLPLPDSRYPNGYTLDKMGYWVDPMRIQTGGDQKVHGVLSGARYQSTGGSTSATLNMDTIDTPIVCLGFRYAWPVPLDQSPDVVQNGIHYTLHTNAPGNNQPQWYPYHNNVTKGHIQWRFVLRPE